MDPAKQNPESESHSPVVKGKRRRCAKIEAGCERVKYGGSTERSQIRNEDVRGGCVLERLLAS